MTSGPGDGGATIEVELTETKGGSDIRLIGEDKGEASLKEQELGAVMDQARDAIGERIDAIDAPAGEAESKEEEPPPGDGETPTAAAEDQAREEPEQPQESEPQPQKGEQQPQDGDQPPEEQENEAAEELPAAGWFPDPWGGERQRYWDGENWTGHLHPPDGEPSRPVSRAAG